MSEIEQRLRAAMHAAVADEQPPANLLQRISARRRRHRAASALACMAVVAAGALLISPAGSALRGGHAAGRPLASLPPRTPGTVLESCSRQIDILNGPDLGQSVRIGPLLLVGFRQAVGIQPDRGFGIGGLEVAIRDNARARVSVADAARPYFRFLFGQSDFVNGVNGRYTLKDGEAGVTFAGCSADAASNSPPGYTLYGGYFLVSKPPRCVSLEIWTSASDRPARITFAAGDAVCGGRR
jgi:hypothetical protein